MRHFQFIVFLSLLIIHHSYSQKYPDLSSTNKKAIKSYEEGNELTKLRLFEQAIESYRQAIARDSIFVEAYFMAAQNYLVLIDRQNAKFFLEKTVELGKDRPDIFPAFLSLADIYMREGNYNGAKTNYESYLQSKYARKTMEPEIRKKIANCDFAIEQKNSPLSYLPKKCDDSANVFQYQYFPTLPADNQTMYFTVRDDNVLEDIYFTKKIPGGWSFPKPISPNINNAKLNEGTCAISGDGRTLVFTSCDRPGGLGRCDLYISTRNGNDWTVPENIGAPLNSPYWESQPSLSADGRILYFVSDKPGGLGRRDIYRSIQNDSGKWSVPVNLGAPVNTKDDEVSPFIHVDGKSFFFASTGHVGMGGFDLFVSQISNDTLYSTPLNMGYPLNSPNDEVSLFITTNGKRAYYSIDLDAGPNRRGGRSLLYEVDLPSEMAIKNKSKLLEGFVFDSKSNLPIDADLELIEIPYGKLIQKSKSDRREGSYKMVLTEGTQFAMYVSKEGYLFKSLNFDVMELKGDDTYKLNVYLDPVAAGSKVALNNLFFETDKYQIEPASEIELKKVIGFLNSNPSVKVEIGGHTDDVGNDQYNFQLSERRAKSVSTYLIDNGIGKDRVTFKGYGKNQPIAPNSSEENRQLNRRIEFKIL